MEKLISKTIITSTLLSFVFTAVSLAYATNRVLDKEKEAAFTFDFENTQRQTTPILLLNKGARQ